MTPDPGRRRLGLGLSAGLALGAVSVPACALPQPASGHIDRLERFVSRHVAARQVDVWLPKGYAAGQPHSVLYMQDGQMLFDALLQECGFSAAQATTCVFEGSGHNELDWARRLEIPLAFLLGGG